MENGFQSQGTLRKRHMGLVGAIVVIVQAIIQHYSTNHSTKNISEDLQQIRADQEKLFAKKEDLKRVSSKLDRIQKDLLLMSNKFGIKQFVVNDTSQNNGTSQF